MVLGTSIAQGVTWYGLSETVLALYLVRLGYGPEFVGSSTAAANLGYALASMPGAAVSRKLGARRAMVLGSAAWVLGILLLSLGDLVPIDLRSAWVLWLRLLASAGLALYMVSSQPYLTTVTSVDERPLVFALVISLRPLGAMAGSLLGGVLPGLFAGWGGVFGSSLADPRPYGLALAVGLLVYAPVFWALRLLPDHAPRKAEAPRKADAPQKAEAPQKADAPGKADAPLPMDLAPGGSGVGHAGASVAPAMDGGCPAPGGDQAAWAGLRARLSTRAPIGVLAAIAIICALRVGGEFTARAFFSVHLDSTWAVSTARIGGALALSNLLSVPAPLVTPALVRRWGRVPTITVGATGVALTIVALGLSTTWVMASAAFVALTVVAAMTRSVWSLVVQEAVPEAWRATSAGVANLFSGLGTMAMSSVGGVMAASLGYRATFLTSAALVGLGAVVVWTTLGQVKRPATPV